MLNHLEFVAVFCILLTVSAIVSAAEVSRGLIGDYRFNIRSPLANSVKGGLPDVALNNFQTHSPPILTGQAIPVGSQTSPGDGYALGWTRWVPKVGYKEWAATDLRIPTDQKLDLGGKFTIWMRVLYGGAVRAGGGYQLLTVDAPSGSPVLEWGTTEGEEVSLTLRTVSRDGVESTSTFETTGGRLLPKFSRWYDLAVSFDSGKIAITATPITAQGSGETAAQEFAAEDGLQLMPTSGPVWILKNVNSALESLRVYDRALTAAEIRALSAHARVPGTATPEAAKVGKVRQLFIDDALIERSSGVENVLHEVEKYPGNPVVPKTQAQEIEGLGPDFWGTVLYDEEERIFKLWHLGITFKEPEILNHLYATSKDGIHWDKPSLGILGPDNRFDAPHYSGGHSGVWLTVRKDSEEKDPGKRYKGFLQHDPLHCVYSPDGLHWTDGPIAAHSTDDTSTVCYHPARKEYLKIGRFCPDGRSLALRLMMVCKSKSPTVEGNTPWNLVIIPTEADLARDPYTQFYHMPAFPHGDSYIGMLGVYHAGPDNGNSEHELTFSRDGMNWIRPFEGKPFIRRGSAGSWDGGFGVIANGPIEVGDWLWFYYGHYNGSHHTLGTASIGLARLRRDGYVSLSAGAAGGTVRTKPFRLDGSEIVVNAAVRGSLRVKVVDSTGVTLAESEDMKGDSCEYLLRLKCDGSTGLIGKTVRLEFLLKDADLYAFQVGNSADFAKERARRQNGYLPAVDPWAPSR